jgi:hypothetical protein
MTSLYFWKIPMKILFKTLIFYFLFNVSAIASNSIADCQVSMGDEDLFKGRCLFSLGEGGSFSLSSLTNEGDLFEGILFLSVYMTGKNKAQVRGLTSDGINSLWTEEIVRDKKDPACWGDGGLKICARKIK